jgi:hypothetical protein
MKAQGKRGSYLENTITKLKNIQASRLDSKYFGEGITFLNDKYTN